MKKSRKQFVPAKSPRPAVSLASVRGGAADLDSIAAGWLHSAEGGHATSD
jgi:hypothetical protein